MHVDESKQTGSLRKTPSMVAIMDPDAPFIDVSGTNASLERTEQAKRTFEFTLQQSTTGAYNSTTTDASSSLDLDKDTFASTRINRQKVQRRSSLRMQSSFNEDTIDFANLTKSGMVIPSNISSNTNVTRTSLAPITGAEMANLSTVEIEKIMNGVARSPKVVLPALEKSVEIDLDELLDECSSDLEDNVVPFSGQSDADANLEVSMDLTDIIKKETIGVEKIRIASAESQQEDAKSRRTSQRRSARWSLKNQDQTGDISRFMGELAADVSSHKLPSMLNTSNADFSAGDVSMSGLLSNIDDDEEVDMEQTQAYGKMRNGNTTKLLNTRSLNDTIAMDETVALGRLKSGQTTVMNSFEMVDISKHDEMGEPASINRTRRSLRLSGGARRVSEDYNVIEKVWEEAVGNAKMDKNFEAQNELASVDIQSTPDEKSSFNSSRQVSTTKRKSELINADAQLDSSTPEKRNNRRKTVRFDEKLVQDTPQVVASPRRISRRISKKNSISSTLQTSASTKDEPIINDGDHQPLHEDMIQGVIAEAKANVKMIPEMQYTSPEKIQEQQMESATTPSRRRIETISVPVYRAAPDEDYTFRVRLLTDNA